MANERMYRPNEEQLELLKRWYAPEVSEPVKPETTNAFGMKSGDAVSPKKSQVAADVSAEVVTEQLPVVTAEALEDIRQSAHDEGFEQGYTKGREKGILDGHDEGYEQGVEQGQTKGLEQGLAQAQEQIESQLAVLSSLIAQFQAPLDNQEQETEHALVELALNVAKKVIHTEVTQSTQPIIQAVTEGVKLLAHTGEIKISLHPQDIEVITTLWSEQELEKRHVELEPDLTLTQGSCEFESKMSSVSSDLEQRITQVFDDFYSQQNPNANENASSPPPDSGSSNQGDHQVDSE